MFHILFNPTVIFVYSHKHTGISLETTDSSINHAETIGSSLSFHSSLLAVDIALIYSAISLLIHDIHFNNPDVYTKILNLDDKFSKYSYGGWYYLRTASAQNHPFDFILDMVHTIVIVGSLITSLMLSIFICRIAPEQSSVLSPLFLLGCGILIGISAFLCLYPCLRTGEQYSESTVVKRLMMTKDPSNSDNDSLIPGYSLKTVPITIHHNRPLITFNPVWATYFLKLGVGLIIGSLFGFAEEYCLSRSVHLYVPITLLLLVIFLVFFILFAVLISKHDFPSFICQCLSHYNPKQKTHTD